MTGRPVKLSDLTESERRFGVAPKRGPGIVYQDDIILMEHGDQAIRSFSSNGLSWTFDANAPQVNEIQPGKIVFATGRAVGRVLALERHGDQVSAILGPVQLTDLVKSGKFAYNQPLDLNSAIAFVAPDYPGAVNSSLMQSSTPGAQSSIRSGSSSSGWHVAQYYVVSDTGKWTPMRTVTGSRDAPANQLYCAPISIPQPGARRGPCRPELFRPISRVFPYLFQPSPPRRFLLRGTWATSFLRQFRSRIQACP